MCGGWALEYYHERHWKWAVAAALVFQAPFSLTIFYFGVAVKAIEGWTTEWLDFVDSTGCAAPASKGKARATNPRRKRVASRSLWIIRGARSGFAPRAPPRRDDRPSPARVRN